MALPILGDLDPYNLATAPTPSLPTGCPKSPQWANAFGLVGVLVAGFAVSIVLAGSSRQLVRFVSPAIVLSGRQWQIVGTVLCHSLLIAIPGIALGFLFSSYVQEIAVIGGIPSSMLSGPARQIGLAALGVAVIWGLLVGLANVRGANRWAPGNEGWE